MEPIVYTLSVDRQNKIQQFPRKSISKLVSFLLAGIDDEIQKIKILHDFVCFWIEYDIEEKNRRIKLKQITCNLTSSNSSSTAPSIVPQIPIVDMKSIQNTKYNEKESVTNADKVWIKCLRTRKGVCDGYARLFKKLCKLANIECKFIHGHSKHPDSSREFYRNVKNNKKIDFNAHAWNAVKVNDKWKLIEVCWDAGSSNKNDKWEAKYSTNYFLSDELIFLTTHIPEDSKWQLLEKPLTLKEYQIYQFY